MEDIPQPKAGQDEVLVRVFASSHNPVDSFSVAGYLQTMQQLPLTPGIDFSGEVVTVGEDVGTFTQCIKIWRTLCYDI